ncbi:MAG: hypothetical protein JXR16_17225 [Bermanella sp.]
MAKIFFPLGVIVSLLLAIVDKNPWKLIITFMFIVMTIQAFKVAEDNPKDADQ